MKIGSGFSMSKRFTGLQFDFEFAVADLNLFLGGSVNSKKEKKGIENHKCNVWDMCGKNADCKHIFLYFPKKQSTKVKI